MVEIEYNSNFVKNGPIANLRQDYSQNYISNLHHLLRNGQMDPNLGSEPKFRRKKNRLVAPGGVKNRVLLILEG